MHHADGANAIVALADVVGRLARLTDYERGTTVNVGVFRGGTRRNVVPDEARCAVDLRVRDAAEGERVDAAIRTLCEQSALPGVALSVDGGIGRPPWRRSPGSERLVAHFQAVADDLEIPLGAEDTGGGSDANFVAALGVPCVDGLGPVGEGVHTDRERIRIETLRQRAKLVAVALLRWQRPVEAEA
jgi:glutamate carboxypeptidase